MNAQISLRAGLLASVAFAMALPAHAQEAFDLDTVYLAESKREVATDTATAETTVDQEEIEDRQADSIAELVDTVPGVTIVNGNTPQGSSINIRGFGATASNGTDQKIAIQLNGADVGSEEIYRVGTQLFTDPALYKEVTVVRGIAGTFEYGSGIIGGLIRAETKDAIDITEGETGFRLRQTIEVGTNGNQAASSTIVAWQPTENFGVIGNYTYRHNGVLVDGAGNPINVKPSNLPTYMVGMLYTFGNADEHSLRATYSDTTAAEEDVPYDSFGLTSDMFGNVDRTVRSRTATLEYKFDSEASDLINVTAAFSRADQQIDSAYIAGSSSFEGTPSWPFVAASVMGLGDADHRYITNKVTLKNQAFFYTGAIAHDLRFGVEGVWKERADASSAPGGTDRRYAVFAVDDITWGGLTVTPAIRYENQRIGSATTAYFDNNALMGGLSGRYEFGSSGFAVFGSVAYTENLPIIDDLDPTSANYPTYMTQSEKARSYELGVSFDRASVFASGDQLSLKVNGFQTNVWDITSYTTPTRVPITDALIRGVELEGSYSLANGFYTDVNANFMRGWGTDATGVQGDWSGIPANQIRATIGKRFGEEYDVSWEVVHDFAMNNTATPTPASTVHNLRATYRPQDGFFDGAEVRFGVENLFDLDYTPHLATRAAPGRTFKVTLAKTF
ncbi:TonB-dependent receptor plug domain-containing protein [Maritimibacter sp. DP1N21-5]|uniref:TonB-dependent receptor plug domain-containing protein n=1 Tax=Maritimibacter sp. DP1N21-5 TaxID=2836867 RepID=UPI001C454022|nr:TonB-dependent receptor plug domain-containing protein [Maritimibacter sp. DP1N21-5]MBV7407702.1 TonB-dependent receptor plug domain-containing protein [Maritimibacter sp. DP1N21-5]